MRWLTQSFFIMLFGAQNTGNPSLRQTLKIKFIPISQKKPSTWGGLSTRLTGSAIMSISLYPYHHPYQSQSSSDKSKQSLRSGSINRVYAIRNSSGKHPIQYLHLENQSFPALLDMSKIKKIIMRRDIFEFLRIPCERERLSLIARPFMAGKERNIN